MDTETSTQSLSWIRRIPGELFAMDEKPLFGSSPTFPLEGFASLLASAFQVKNIEFHVENWEWRTKEELYKGYGDKLKITALNITPIEGPLWWLMSQLDFSRMMAHILAVDGIDTVDPALNEALSTFFIMQLMDAFGKCDFDKKLSMQVLNESSEPSTACLTLDIETTIQEGTFPGRLLLSPEFRHNWKQRYIQEEKKLMLESPLAESLEVEVHLEAGRLNIAIEEWNLLKDGDFVVLENCSLDPEEDKGRVMLVINGTPFFRAKLKQGSLKILEYPLYYEVPSMNTPINEDSKNHDADEFDDEFNDIESDTDEEDSNESNDDENEKADEQDNDFDEDFELDEEDDEDEDDEDDEEKADDLGETDEAERSEETEDFEDLEEEKATVKATKKKEKNEKADKSAPKKPTSLEEIPLCVVLEVGRIQMSVKKLLELQPGNMLELDIHPEAGVDMVVNGRRVARGELLKIGDAIGVRISERL